MRSFTVAAAAAGLASSIVSAAPVAAGTAPSGPVASSSSAWNASRRPSWGQGGHGGHGQGGHGYGGHGNGGQGSSNGVGVEIVGDGFPTPDAQQLLDIEAQAKGTLSNAPPPPSLSADTAISVRLVNLNENFESVYFKDLLNNITSNVNGYGPDEFVSDEQRLFVINALEAVVAQEELHALNAAGALKNVVKTNPIEPCRYQFPVSDFKSAISLAARFTDVVLGTLQDVQFRAAQNGDAGFVPGVGATIGQEGEQDGFYRALQGLRPSQLPFLTRSVRDFAFSALQDFVIPGSCPNLNEIDLTIFQPLIAADPPAKTTDITFSFNFLKQTRFVPEGTNTPDVKDFASTYGNGKWEGQLFITYLNQQNVPVSRPLKTAEINFESGDVSVTAEFPFDDVVNGTPLEMNGLTFATLTKGQNFAKADDMDAATLFGPALLEAIEPPIEA